MLSDVRIEGKEYPWVLLIHGSGRCADSYWETPFYIRQRRISRACGCAVAAASVGPDIWGKENALDVLMRMIEDMTAQGHSPHPAVWATSAGGTQMFRIAQQYPDVPRLLIGTFPVWDMEACENLASYRAAWGNDRAGAHTRNPAAYPPPAQPLVILQGKQDIALPLSKHFERLAALRSFAYHLTDDGHSTEAFSLYDTPLISQALEKYAREENGDAPTDN